MRRRTIGGALINCSGHCTEKPTWCHATATAITIAIAIAALTGHLCGALYNYNYNDHSAMRNDSGSSSSVSNSNSSSSNSSSGSTSSSSTSSNTDIDITTGIGGGSGSGFGPMGTLPRKWLVVNTPQLEAKYPLDGCAYVADYSCVCNIRISADCAGVSQVHDVPLQLSSILCSFYGDYEEYGAAIDFTRLGSHHTRDEYWETRVDKVNKLVLAKASLRAAAPLS